jgi:hypothetical protein
MHISAQKKAFTMDKSSLLTLPAATHLSTIILTLGYALLRTAFTSHGVGGAVLPMSVHFSRRVSCLAFLETPLIIIER